MFYIYIKSVFFFLCQEVPEGASACLAGLTFVISGTLDRYLIFSFIHKCVLLVYA